MTGWSGMVQWKITWHSGKTKHKNTSFVFGRTSTSAKNKFKRTHKYEVIDKIVKI